ncbi:MAG: DUF4430 domain-containing protein [Erysipelotrichaceae bacterium]|nr:DUF4430 domain-containing protein [Erysipelotrichaceae bacterium]
MKKLTVLFIALALMLSLAACTNTKKDEVIGKGQNKITIKVVDQSGQEKNYSLATDAGTIYDAMLELSKDKSADFNFDVTEVAGYKVVTTINGLKADFDNNIYWEFNVAGVTSERTAELVPVEDNGQYAFIYVDNGKETIMGGWEACDGYSQILNEDDKARFEKAVEGLLGVEYTPIQVLASQVVSGRNYAYLAQGTTVTATPKKAFYILKVYEDLDGKVELSSAMEIEHDYVLTTNENDANQLGGWKAETNGKAGMFSLEEAETSFEKAMEGYTGLNLKPIVLLGKQIVNGTNYIGLAEGTTVTAKPETNIYVVEWHGDLDGSAKITNVSLLNLAYYLDAK